MAATTDYNDMCPLFDWQYNSSGVVFPFLLPTRVNLDATISTAFLRAVKLPGKFRLLSADAYACTDDQGLKTAAASIEPIIAISYGTSGLASAGAGTEFCLITCDATGFLGKKWAGTTTQTTLSDTQELWVYLKAAAGKGGGASGTVDGAARIILWIASMNSPA